LDRRLVIGADTGEGGELARARLGVMALGVAALADFGGRRDMDFTERGIGDVARGGAVFARRRDRGGFPSAVREVRTTLASLPQTKPS